MRAPRRPAARLLATLVAVAVVALGTAGCGLLGGGGTKRVTASFGRTVGLYESSDVRILGVAIGKVTKITPEGQTVRVEMEYDSKYKIPADAKAVIIAPSVVSDRYVQLAPTYEGGPQLADGAVLPMDRTVVPVELDKIFSSVDRLNYALGPDGANKDGALSDLLSVSAKNLKGNGKALGTTLHDFSTAVQTLANQRADLFGTITNLQAFTTVLAQNDATVRRFNTDLAAVAAQLAGEKGDLAQAIRSLSVALGEVASFVKENKDSLTKNVHDLTSITGTLVRQKAALEEFIDNSPTALSNLQLAYNPSSGTLDTRANNTGSLLTFTLCSIASNPGGKLPANLVAPLQAACTKALTDLGLDPTTIPGLISDPSKIPGAITKVLGGLGGLGGSGGSGGVAGLAKNAPKQVPAAASTATPTDMTLSGFLGAAR